MSASWSEDVLSSREMKLPEWARSALTTARRRAVELERQLAETTRDVEDAPVTVRVIDDRRAAVDGIYRFAVDAPLLPMGGQRMHPQEGWIDVYREGGQIVVRGAHPLALAATSSNTYQVWVADR